MREDLDAVITSEREGDPFLPLPEIEIDTFQTKENLIEELMRLSEPRYRSFWNLCSEPERLLLFQLARDGIVNGSNEVLIRELERKGLITLKPIPRLVNESFRLFVSRRETDISAAWETDTETQHSNLDLIWPAIFVLGIYILITQRKYFDNITPVLSAIGAQLLSLFKMFDSFREVLIKPRAK